jgi:PAS domain-containing protein
VQQALTKYPLVFRIITTNVETRWLSNQAIVLLDSNGIPEKTIGVCQDVTEHKRAEQLLTESEERYRILSTNSADMISRHSADGKVLFVSPVSESLTGYKPSELIGKEGTFFIPG